MKNVRQLMISKRPDDYMHVVRHDSPGDQLIMIPVKVPECVLNGSGDSLILEVTGTSAVVQNRVDFLRIKVLQLPSFWQRQFAVLIPCTLFDSLSLSSPGFHDRRRQGIRQAEGYAVGSADLSPMW